MDMSFARRRKSNPDPRTPDLAVLLAEMSARQGASRTAQVSAGLQSQPADIAAHPLVAIFAPDGPAVVSTTSFGDPAATLVIPRQSE